MSPLLEVRDLCTTFPGPTAEPAARPVDGVSFTLEAGETLGLVGESGCGKSLTALSLLGLVPEPGSVTRGSVRLAGRDLTSLSRRELTRVRGREIAMIFQEPMTALNPVYRVGEQIAETLRHHRGLSRRDARSRATQLLERVGLPDPGLYVDAFPHQLSGGMRQRVLIAIAISCEPRVLIADEPTTALDVTVQAQILELLAELREERGLGVLFITHDLGVLAETADRVAVMYAGKIVEEATTDALLLRPRHPYTAGLLRSRPGSVPRGARLPAIEGVVPGPSALPSGCAFHPRCEHAFDTCRERAPLLSERASGHRAACHLENEEELR